MAKKAKANTQDALMADIFGSENDRGDEERENEGKPASTEALMARIEGMQADLTRLTRTNTALMANTSQYTPNQRQEEAPGEPKVDVKGLPDPISDPEGYHNEVTKRISGSIHADLNRQRAQDQAAMADRQQQGQRIEALWQDFEAAHPDLAKHEDMARLVAQGVAEKAQQRGLDVQRYMFGASEQYIADVATEMKRRFGKAIEVMNADEGGEEEETPEVTPENARTAFRTQGIIGGVAGGEGKGKTKDPAPADDFVSDLNKVQRSMGLI